jgi:tetratricopeptide (TPR) repeat protein
MSEINEGVYREKSEQKIGTGSTSRNQKVENYFLAKNLGSGKVEVQMLNIDGDPIPFKEVVPVEDFYLRFEYVPDFRKTRKSPREKTIDKAIAQAENHYQRKEYYSAEFEYNKALKLDEENVRANFGVGRVYLAQGETDKARETFEKLSKIDAVFDTENKHIFNELGIELRRLKLYDQAIAYYTRALSFSQDDEHLFFNVGRAYLEKGDLKRAGACAQKALKLNPEFDRAKKLMAAVRNGIRSQTSELS